MVKSIGIQKLKDNIAKNGERWLSWSKALDSKSSVLPKVVPWVRIPLSPPIFN